MFSEAPAAYSAVRTSYASCVTRCPAMSVRLALNLGRSESTLWRGMTVI
jgi:hypothetical protein